MLIRQIVLIPEQFTGKVQHILLEGKGEEK